MQGVHVMLYIYFISLLLNSMSSVDIFLCFFLTLRVWIQTLRKQVDIKNVHAITNKLGRKG